MQILEKISGGYQVVAASVTVANNSEHAQQLKGCCKDCGTWFAHYWRMEIPEAKVDGNPWHLFKKEIHGRSSFYAYKNELYLPFKRDWAALNGVKIAFSVIPLSVVSCLFHLTKASVKKYESTRTIWDIYQREKGKRDHNGIAFLRNYSWQWVLSGKDDFSYAAKDLYCGVATVLTGLYFCYNPYSAPTLERIREHWHPGVSQLTDRQIEELSVLDGMKAMLDGSYSLNRMFGLHKVGMIESSSSKPPKREESKRTPHIPLPQPLDTNQRAEVMGEVEPSQFEGQKKEV